MIITPFFYIKSSLILLYLLASAASECDRSPPSVDPPQDDLKYQPSHSTSRPPRFDVSDLYFNWPNPTGNGDKFLAGHNMRYSSVMIRPNTSEEACSDLRQPKFNKCIAPLVMWTRWPFNLAEAFGALFARLHAVLQPQQQQSQPSWYQDVLPVLATPHGLRAPSYIPFFFKSLFDHRLQTLAQLSDRDASCDSDVQERGHEEQSDGDRRESKNGIGRCFSQIHLCKLRSRHEVSVVAAAQHLQQHYKDEVQQALLKAGGGPWRTQEESLKESNDNKVLHVVVASRPSGGGRSLLNKEELVRKCNAWSPSEFDISTNDERVHQRHILNFSHERGHPNYHDLQRRTPVTTSSSNRTISQVTTSRSRRTISWAHRHWDSAHCIEHVFGSGGILLDMGVMASADVLVCLHGAACLNSLFMPNGSSLVEIRPLGMSPAWANQYFFRPLQHERLLYWYGINIQDPANSEPSPLELQKSEVLNSEVKARERNVNLPWSSLKHHLDLIAHVGRMGENYRSIYRSGKFYINDKEQPIKARSKLPTGVGWA